jgi:hypothetical protein
MNARLIPWCLATTGFLVSLSVFTWQGKRYDPARAVQAQAAVGQRLRPPALDGGAFRSSQTRAASAAPQNVAAMPILPLPPAMQTEPDPTVQPVPDDAPTVEDLPARRSPPESPDSE